MTDSSIDTAHLKRALSAYASGLTVVGALIDGVPVGFTCQAFSSLSLDPPLISLAIMNSSTSWPKIRTASNFSVSILSATQEHVSRGFGRSSADRWKGIDWRSTDSGVPIISGAIVSLECKLREELEIGDHTLAIAQVHQIFDRDDIGMVNPLLYFQSQYRTLAST